MSSEYEAQRAPVVSRDRGAVRFVMDPNPLSPSQNSLDGRSRVVIVAGGLLTGLLVATTLLASAPRPQILELDQVPLDDVLTASQSLVQSRAAALVEDAKSCRQPLASVTMRSTGPGGGTIRFHVGTYLSPKIRLDPKPQRVALPFPAPYEVGHGDITIETSGDGVDVFLKPGFHLEPGSGTTTTSVHWTPKEPC